MDVENTWKVFGIKPIAMEVTPENVEGAVLEFYRNPSKVNSQCHEWLKLCQSSPQAWQVVWPLFDQSKDIQVQFVAANMLYFKVSRCLHEVPEADYPGLKDKLLNTLAGYVTGPVIVLTRLELTVKSLLICVASSLPV